MHFRFILILIIAHLLCDFVFQTNFIIRKRFSKLIKEILVGNIIHSIIHYFCIVFLLLLYYLLNRTISLAAYLKISFFVICTHFLIDLIKSLLIYYKFCDKHNIYVFMIDQILHITLILLIVFNFNVENIILKIIDFTDNFPLNINSLDKWLIIIIIFLSCTFVGGNFIRNFMTYINTKKYKYSINKMEMQNSKKMRLKVLGISRAGYMIGILERTLILIGMATNNPEIIGFVLAVKSIARFKELDDPSFVEYYIIGTFISFIIGIIGGIIIRSLYNVPIIK